MNIDRLYEQLEEKRNAITALLDKVEEEERDMSDDEYTSFQDLKKERDDLQVKIERAEELEAAKKEAAAAKKKPNDVRRSKPNQTPEEKVAKDFSWLRFIQAINPANKNPLDGAERELAQEGRNELNAAGLTGEGTQLPGWLMRMEQRAALNVTTTTQGGHTVETELGGMIPYLDPDPIVARLGATVLTGLSGNIDFPRNDAVGTASWEGETDANAAADPTFDKVQMSPNRLGAYTRFSKQLLAQSSIGVENFVRNRLSQAMGVALDTAAVNGSGASNQPTGILNVSGIGDVDLGVDGGALTWAKVLEFAQDLDDNDALMGNIAFLTTPGVKYHMMGVEKSATTGQYLLQDPGSSLLGFPILTSTTVPSNLTDGAGTSLHAMILGNWSELIIGQWGNAIDVVVDPYSKVLNAQVQIVVNAWYDIAVRHAESFTAAQDIDIS